MKIGFPLETDFKNTSKEETEYVYSGFLKPHIKSGIVILSLWYLCVNNPRCRILCKHLNKKYFQFLKYWLNNNFEY